MLKILLDVMNAIKIPGIQQQKTHSLKKWVLQYISHALANNELNTKVIPV